MATNSIGKMVVEILGYSKGLDDTINKSKKELDGLAKSGTKTSKTLETAGKLVKTAFASVIIASIVKIGKELITVASDAEETRNKFNVTFSSIMDDADEAAKALADGFGLSQTAAEDLLSTTGDLLSGFGFTQTAALDLATQTNELAADLASFANVPVKQASDAITKGLLGERESMKLLGIAILEADINQLAEDKGIVGELTRQQKAMLTLELATIQSKNAIGDFARSQDSFANQSKIAQSAVEDLKVEIGKNLLPIATQSVRIFGDIAEKLAEFVEERNKLVEAQLADQEGNATLEQQLILLQRRRDELNGTVTAYKSIGLVGKKNSEDQQARKDAELAVINATINAIRLQAAAEKSLDDEQKAAAEVAASEAEAEKERAEKRLADIQFRDELWGKTEEARKQAIEAEIAELETFKASDERAQEALAYLREELAGFTEESIDSANSIMDYALLQYNYEKDLRTKAEAEKEENYKKELDRIEKEKQAREDAAMAVYGALKGLADSYYESQLSLYEEDDAQYKKLKEEQFNTNKLTSAIDAGINGAVAATKALAELGPIFGPIAAVSLGGLTAAQVGFILGQQPPAFADGGIVMPSPGGTIARVAEAGQAEVIFPLDKLQSMMGGEMGGNIYLTVEMDSAPILKKIFPATRNRQILIDSRAVV